MALDATILAIFGEPPAGTDLSDEVTTPYNIVSIVFFTLASLSVALRFYVRMNNNTVDKDDYMVVAGLVSWMSSRSDLRASTNTSCQQFSSAALVATTILGPNEPPHRTNMYQCRD